MDEREGVIEASERIAVAIAWGTCRAFASCSLPASSTALMAVSQPTRKLSFVESDRSRRDHAREARAARGRPVRDWRS